MLRFITTFLSALMLLLLCCPGSISAQSGMTLSEFRKKLEPYFDNELLDDIDKQLPQGTEYRIWGWDVGDFSGDGFNDLAFAVKLSIEKKKQTMVYLFTDEEGFLTNVAQFPYPYVELPLEVGVVIKNNACFITRKREQYSWVVRGYTYDNGSVILQDEFTTARYDKYTRETYRNYQNLEARERLLETNEGKTSFDHKYLTIPCYSRGRQIYRGYAGAAIARDPDFVTSGAFYWKGEQDCSFAVKSVVYDDNFLYLTIAVTDDEIITGRCDTCTADYVDLWFDSSPPASDLDQFLSARLNKRKRKNNKSGKVSDKQLDSGLVKISIRLGDFMERRAFYSVETSEDLEGPQKSATTQVKAVSSLRKNGYTVKVRIPFLLIGFESAPTDEKQPYEIGCSIAVHDSDNQFRPEEETLLATSRLEELNPVTFGSLVLIPRDQWYGETTNLYADSLIKFITELGF
jgi:hypothetical protein